MVSPAPLLQVILDTNVHSDWADEPCRLPSHHAAGLDMLLARPGVSLVIPGELFVEFQWPREKQLRWYDRVISRLSHVAVGFVSPVRWGLDAELARMRGKRPGDFPIAHLTPSSLMAQMQTWHPSNTVTVLSDAMRLATHADASARLADARPPEVSKAAFVRYRKEKHLVAAQILGTHCGLDKLASHLKSAEFQASAREELRAAVPGGTSQMEAFIDHTLATELPGTLDRYRVLSEPELAATLDKQKEMTTLLGFLDDTVTEGEAASLCKSYLMQQDSLPALRIFCGVQSNLDRQYTRKPRPSDIVDARLLPWLTVVDVVTTDGDMARILRDSHPPATHGRLYARAELDQMLHDVGVVAGGGI